MPASGCCSELGPSPHLMLHSPKQFSPFININSNLSQDGASNQKARQAASSGGFAHIQLKKPLHSHHGIVCLLFTSPFPLALLHFKISSHLSPLPRDQNKSSHLILWKIIWPTFMVLVRFDAKA